MSYSVKKNTIYLTRGDTFRATIALKDAEGEIYTPESDETIRFAMKKNYEDAEPLLLISVPYDTLELVILPNDTKELPFGSYVWDMQITRSNGDIDTFITKAQLVLTEEVE